MQVKAASGLGKFANINYSIGVFFIFSFKMSARTGEGVEIALDCLLKYE
jgi:hypothetical protein